MYLELVIPALLMLNTGQDTQILSILLEVGTNRTAFSNAQLLYNRAFIQEGDRLSKALKLHVTHRHGSALCGYLHTDVHQPMLGSAQA